MGKNSSLIMVRSHAARNAEKHRKLYTYLFKEGTQDYQVLKNAETLNRLMQNITDEEYHNILNRS